MESNPWKGVKRTEKTAYSGPLLEVPVQGAGKSVARNMIILAELKDSQAFGPENPLLTEHLLASLEGVCHGTHFGEGCFEVLCCNSIRTLRPQSLDYANVSLRDPCWLGRGKDECFLLLSLALWPSPPPQNPQEGENTHCLGRLPPLRWLQCL